MTWRELAWRLWMLGRVVLHDIRKAYRRRVRRWRYRHGVTLYSKYREHPELELRPGTLIPIPSASADFVDLNVLLKQCYTDSIAMGVIEAEARLKMERLERLQMRVHRPMIVPPANRESDDLDDTAFIFPCHRDVQ